jgi:hypothetical protein
MSSAFCVGVDGHFATDEDTTLFKPLCEVQVVGLGQQGAWCRLCCALCMLLTLCSMPCHKAPSCTTACPHLLLYVHGIC